MCRKRVFAKKTKERILSMREQLRDDHFTRKHASELFGLKLSTASELLRKLLLTGVIEKDDKLGRGFYRFLNYV